MTPYLVTLRNGPQTLSISLGGITYRLTLHWNAPSAAWLVDIANANGVPIVCSIPLVTGSDLLGQYAYLGIGGQLIVQTDYSPYAVPTFENLGANGQLYFVAP